MAGVTADFKIQNLFGLNDKVVLVTGGGTGIGLMIAQGFAENGATVYIGGRRKDVVDKVAAGFANSNTKGKILSLQLDVTSKDSISAAVKSIESAHGKLDVLVNNAGQVGPRSSFMNDPKAPERTSPGTLGTALFEKETFEQWSDVFSINVSSFFFVTMAFLGLLDAASKADEPYSANVINITSISGSMKVSQAHFAYNASKAAGDHVTKMLATEFALKGAKVRVNAIAPGLFATEMSAREGGVFNDPDEVTKYSGALITVPAGRGGRPEEIAGPAIFLASKAGIYTNGQVLVVDGSWETVNPSTR